jgi:hypothetical protein
MSVTDDLRLCVPRQFERRFQSGSLRLPLSVDTLYGVVGADTSLLLFCPRALRQCTLFHLGTWRVSNTLAIQEVKFLPFYVGHRRPSTLRSSSVTTSGTGSGTGSEEYTTDDTEADETDSDEGHADGDYTRGEISSVLCRSPTTFDSAFLVDSSAAFSRARESHNARYVRPHSDDYDIRNGKRNRLGRVYDGRLARVVFTVCGVIARGGPNVSAPTEVSSRRSLTVDGGVPAGNYAGPIKTMTRWTIGAEVDLPSTSSAGGAGCSPSAA